MYAAELGRFLQRDPLAIGDGSELLYSDEYVVRRHGENFRLDDLYEYALGNPLIFSDPEGLAPENCLQSPCNTGESLVKAKASLVTDIVSTTAAANGKYIQVKIKYDSVTVECCCDSSTLKSCRKISSNVLPVGAGKMVTVTINMPQGKSANQTNKDALAMEAFAISCWRKKHETGSNSKDCLDQHNMTYCKEAVS